MSQDLHPPPIELGIAIWSWKARLWLVNKVTVNLQEKWSVNEADFAHSKSINDRDSQLADLLVSRFMLLLKLTPIITDHRLAPFYPAEISRPHFLMRPHSAFKKLVWRWGWGYSACVYYLLRYHSLSTRELRVPFENGSDAEVAYQSLVVDPEPRRSGVTKVLRVEGNVLLVWVDC